MRISKHHRREAKGLFRSCQVNGALDEERVRRAVRAVIEAKPRGYLGVLSHFQRLVKLDLERRTARIESATPLDEAVQQRVRDNLSRIYGPQLNFSFAHNAGLLGGVRIQVGSDVYDATIHGRLAMLRESF